MRYLRYLWPTSRVARDKPWLRTLLTLFWVIVFCLAIWFGLPMAGAGWWSSVWFRATIISVVIGAVLLFSLIGWIRRRRAAKKLEDELIPAAPVGDGKVLAERMTAALATLKKSGGRSYLYDLPWYVIIGPPGAGKTTALRNAGIEFPLADTDGGVVEGFGGTRNCDWWFSEDAILIDTAGRYTTQDSHKEADESSWQAFLSLLKRGRPKQPINGVILAFSVADMIEASEEQIAAHAATVRARLAEIHETLKIDFPVYVLFTKADLIAGFREYFASFSQSRRKGVWGATFQTRDRGAQTWDQVPAEYDRLVARLSEEVIDRMNEEPDGVARIAIFGLPDQLAMLRDNVSDFLRRVFEPTRYKTNAILRGFYFTSGTQEGTPIDQVLGAMARNSDSLPDAFQPSFVSGKGKSFFLHDLLTKVIFAERDWVSHDARAVRRSFILRSLAMALIGVMTFGSLAAFGYSYWHNAALVRTADTEAGRYAREAAPEIAREIIDDPDLTPVLKPLQDLRIMSAGYGSTEEATLWQGLGLGQRTRLELASDKAYSDALERMLRPRLILQMERELPRLIADDDTSGIYRALKVYMLLGGAGERPDDDAIKAYFADIWRQEFGALDNFSAREQLNAHLAAMLDLDDSRQLLVGVVADTVTKAQEAIVQLPLAEQAYSSIKDQVFSAGLPDFNLVERTGPNSRLVFRTTDGSDIDDVGVPALFTYEGYWGYFFEQLNGAADRLKDDRWVLGPAGERVEFDSQIAGLSRALHTTYQREFRDAWEAMFDQIALNPMSADKPNYNALAAAASSTASPILDLVQAVERETRLSAELEELANLSPEALAGGGVAGDVSDVALKRLRSRSGALQRVLLDSVTGGGKSQERPGGAGGGSGGADSFKRAVELIDEQFEDWHVLLRGNVGQRPIDVLLANLSNIRDNLRLSATTGSQANAVLPQLLSALTKNNSQLPGPLARWVNEAEQSFRTDAQDASLVEMNRALNDEVYLFCRENVTALYPFRASDRHISPRIFGEFFGPDGRMDRYFKTYLEPNVTRTPEGLVPRSDRPLGERLSANTLLQFERAEKLRDAFFASGSQEPSVEMFISHISSQSTIREAVLVINGRTVTSRTGDLPADVVWPGQGSSVTLQFIPDRDRTSLQKFADGRWSIVDFIRKAQARSQNGNILELTQNIGGRTITYRIEFNSTTVPFTMRELTDFECPASLD